MNLKLDENIPRDLVADLRALGHDPDTVWDEGLTGREDLEVWQATQIAVRMLVTQDLDFSDARTFAPGTHHGLVLLRIREPGLLALRARVRGVFEREPVDTWQGCVVVVSDRKVRVRRPPAL